MSEWSSCCTLNQKENLVRNDYKLWDKYFKGKGEIIVYVKKLSLALEYVEIFFCKIRSYMYFGDVSSNNLHTYPIPYPTLKLFFDLPPKLVVKGTATMVGGLACVPSPSIPIMARDIFFWQMACQKNFRVSSRNSCRWAASINSG